MPPGNLFLRLCLFVRVCGFEVLKALGNHSAYMCMDCAYMCMDVRDRVCKWVYVCVCARVFVCLCLCLMKSDFFYRSYFVKMSFCFIFKAKKTYSNKSQMFIKSYPFLYIIVWSFVMLETINCACLAKQRVSGTSKATTLREHVILIGRHAVSIFSL